MQSYFYLKNRLENRIYQYHYKIMEDGKFYEGGAVLRAEGLPVANYNKQQAVSFLLYRKLLVS